MAEEDTARGPKRCGAHSRSTGKPCRKSPKRGRTRCRLHGGATPLSARYNALKTGVYAKGVLPHEKETLEAIKRKGTDIDEEIWMIRLHLSRLYPMQALWHELHPDSVPRSKKEADKLPIVQQETEIAEVEHITDEDGKRHKRDIRKKLLQRRTDFSKEIRLYTAMLINAVGRKAELEQLSQSEDLQSRMAQALRDVGDAALADLEEGDPGAEGTEPGAADDDDGKGGAAE